MPKLFEELRRRLLVAGVAPRHIRRYIAELEDHLADLRREAPNEAAAAARLGDLDTLAQPMLDRPEFRSWTARAPWMTLIGGPILAMVAATAAVCLPFVAYGAIFLAMQPPNAPRGIEPMWLQYTAHAATYFLVYMAPILIGWAVSLMAIERRLAPMWPIVGLVVFAAVTGTFDIGVSFPKVAGEHGELRIGWGWWGEFSTQHSDIRTALNLVLTAGPYLFWHTRNRREHLAYG